MHDRGENRPAEQAVHLTRTAAQHPAVSAAHGWNPWVLSPAVFVSAAIVTFLLLFLRTGSVTASTPPPNPLFDPRNANLQMRVETDGPGLLLSWNRYSRTVQAASNALLAIQDGAEHRDIALDRNQVLTGSVFYRPASDDVSFRLELRDARGSNVSQILRVLDAAPRRPVPQPMPPSEEKPAARARIPERSRDSAPKAVPMQHQTPAPVQVASAAPPPGTASPKPLTQAPALNPSPAPAQSTPPQLQPPPALKQADTPAPSTPPIQSVAPSIAPPQPAATRAPSPSPAPKDLPAYVPPRPLKWVQPNWPMPQPLDVKVKVRIDEAGRVVAAHALMDGIRDKKVLGAAAAAVRQWTFEPAKAHGANVPCEEIIIIHFGPEAQ